MGPMPARITGLLAAHIKGGTRYGIVGNGVGWFDVVRQVYRYVCVMAFLRKLLSDFIESDGRNSGGLFFQREGKLYSEMEVQ